MELSVGKSFSGELVGCTDNREYGIESAVCIIYAYVPNSLVPSLGLLAEIHAYVEPVIIRQFEIVRHFV